MERPEREPKRRERLRLYEDIMFWICIVVLAGLVIWVLYNVRS